MCCVFFFRFISIVMDHRVIANHLCIYLIVNWHIFLSVFFRTLKVLKRIGQVNGTTELRFVRKILSRQVRLCSSGNRSWMNDVNKQQQRHHKLHNCELNHFDFFYSVFISDPRHNVQFKTIQCLSVARYDCNMAKAVHTFYGIIITVRVSLNYIPQVYWKHCRYFYQ